MAILILCIITVVATFSRGGFVGLLVLGLFAVKNSRNKVSSFLVVAAAGLAIYGLAPESWFARLDTINDASSDTSFTSRLVAWKISLLIALDRPWFGGGFHAIQQGLVWETYRPFLHLVDFVTTPPAGERAIAAHSVWFEILGDLGFVGLAVFLAVLGMAFWNCRRVYKLANQDPSLQWAADLARMIQISLATYVVTSSALSQGYSEIFYIVVALASRVRRTVHESLATRATTQTAPTRPPIRNPAPWDAPVLR